MGGKYCSKWLCYTGWICIDEYNRLMEEKYIYGGKMDVVIMYVN